MSITSNERYKKLFTSTVRFRNTLIRLGLINRIRGLDIADFCIRRLKPEDL